MFGFKFYHGTIRKYITLFGTIFNQIYIDRVDSDENITSTLRVPIVYGPRDKALERIQSNPDFEKKFQSVLPYMAFEMGSPRYDGQRNLQTSQREVSRNANKNLASWVYTPVAYNFPFKLYISARHAEDSNRIIEQIAPFFTPDWTVTVKLLDDPLIIKDIPIVLVDHQIDDSWEGSYNDKREIVHTLSFEVKGYLFGPAKKSKIIKVFKGEVGSSGAKNATIMVLPGLTPDGKPTSDIEDTLPWSEISWEDDFGYITESTLE